MINKEKNVAIQVTFPKQDAEQLQVLKEAFNKEGIKATKSDILLQAFRDYLKMLVMCDKAFNIEEEPHKENKDA